MTIRVTVSQLNMDKPDCDKVLYRNTIVYDDNLVFPFNDIYSSLRILYPQKYVTINFALSE